ncbi:hypothetical protein [Myxococcus landrumensis]|uniref:Lipoprotein n=1 Tax=Myxococcus landrumensis TaxID=2813577 RepID=A0ABX7NDQ8_9BACT|nr:hypothetical protein [Myxococcus landrumus]QSQ16952.1 hypothetical protein JY572_13255 [Myxococcus landrumus]
MYVSRTSVWGRTSVTLALALGLTVLGCNGDGDGDEGPPVTATLTGKVTYDFVPASYSPATRSGTLGFNQVTVKPVRDVTIQVLGKNNAVLGKATTDENGRYSLTYTAGEGANVTLAALAKTTTPSIQVEDNTSNNAVWAVSTQFKGGATSQDLHAGHGWTGNSYNANMRAAAPFAILDSMYTASKAFLAVRPVPFPPLKVNWSPKNAPERGQVSSGQIGTSHFSPSENEIYVLGMAGVDTDEFDSHVIVHEWGHFFEANLSRSDNPGGSHSSGDILDPRIAFGEGYGNAISAILLPTSVYVDTLWNRGSLVAFGFDMESAPVPSDDPSPGVFSEFSVMRFLYDLHDGTSVAESTYDQVSLNLGILYDVLVGPQKTAAGVTTIGSFIHGLKAQSGVNASAVDTLAAHYGIGSIRSTFGEGDSDLAGMYTQVSSLPYNIASTLQSGAAHNRRSQNRYYVFTGTGRTVTVTASSVDDVGILALQNGTQVGEADATVSGQETFSFNSQAGKVYVVVLTGYRIGDDDAPESYSFNLSISSQ